MSPEQIKGRDVDARCDQFAWGVMAYELVAGERPWPDNGDVLQLVAKVLTDPPPPLRSRGIDVPASVEETILRALAKEPDARFPTMADVADAVEPFAMQTHRRRPRADHAARLRVRGPERLRGDDARTGERLGPAGAPRPPRAPSAPERKSDASEEALASQAHAARAAARAPRRPSPRSSCSFGRARTCRRRRMPSRPLSTVPEAEVAYKEAMQLWHDGATGKARTTLRRAVELDPTFAAAHLQLAIQTVQDDPAGAQASFQNAFEHRHMLLPRDTAMLEACEPYVRPRPDLDEWETRLTGAVFQFPRDAELQFFLGRARERQGADEAAKAAYEAAVRLDSGFVPALAALANAERNLGHVTEALAATERCIKQSPVAATCLETRYRLLSDLGECHRAREEAAQWRTLEPQSPTAFTAFARALYADGAPAPERRGGALARVGALSAGEARVERAVGSHVSRDRRRRPRARRPARSRLRGGSSRRSPPTSTTTPCRRACRINVLYESEDLDAAVKVAHGFLDRMDAWPAYPFAPDASIAFYEPLYRAGEIKKAELDRQRMRWMEREKQRLAGGDRSTRAAWGMWAIWGGFAETKEEALEAIGRMPQIPLPVGSRRAGRASISPSARSTRSSDARARRCPRSSA